MKQIINKLSRELKLLLIFLKYSILGLKVYNFEVAEFVSLQFTNRRALLWYEKM